MRNRVRLALLIFVVLTLVAGACAPTGGNATPTPAPPTNTPTVTPTFTPTPTMTPRPAPTVTPTPTPAFGVVLSPTPAPQGICAGMQGSLEVQILVGPSAAVGLSPHAVGNLPFSVSNTGPPYAVSGGGTIAYADVLREAWGTYAVTLRMDGTISGECVEQGQAATLNLHIEMSGEQNVEVETERFHGNYPWSGTHAFDLSFPAEEGAAAEGEGWRFVVHLD